MKYVFLTQGVFDSICRQTGSICRIVSCPRVSPDNSGDKFGTLYRDLSTPACQLHLHETQGGRPLHRYLDHWLRGDKVTRSLDISFRTNILTLIISSYFCTITVNELRITLFYFLPCFFQPNVGNSATQNSALH